MRVPASLFVFERVRVRCSFRRFVQARVCANVSERVARRVGWLVHLVYWWCFEVSVHPR